MVALYDALKSAVEASPQYDRYVDLTHIFDGADRLALYKGSVHPGNAGSELLGEALLAPSLAALATATQVKPPPQRCERMR